MRDELLEELAVGIEESPPDAQLGLVDLVVDLRQEQVLHGRCPGSATIPSRSFAQRSPIGM